MGMEVTVSAESTSNCEQSLISIKQSVVSALVSVSKNETTEYEKLIFQWRELSIHESETDDFLQSRLKALSQAVSYINERDHGTLLSYVLGMSLWMHSLAVADALIEFVINLATVNGGCVAQCLDMLVRNFIPPSSGLPIFVDFFSRRALMKGMSKENLTSRKSEHMERKDAILQKVHSAIKRIAELVPMTALHLQPIVIQRMPHRITEKEWNALYLENMLWLAKDAQGDYIRKQMLMAVVDRLIEIDVEIRWEDIVREDDSSKVFIFNMEFDEMLEENEAGPGIEAHQVVGDLTSVNGEKRQTLCVIADKMDMLMDMTFQHLQNGVDAGRTEQIFDILMSSFQSTILDTYKSKFTQFLIFYMCSIAPATCGGKFAAVLCDILASPNRAPNTRMSAAAYLASFLARAKYLPLSVVSSSLKRVIDWCIGYSPRQTESKGTNIDAAVHGVFYSACQAIMYVLCFRMKKLLDDPIEREILRSLRINEFLSHVLNPLKLCLPSVVEEFMKQSTAARLVNTRMSLQVNKTMESLALNTFGGVNRLDMFFPFDPYLLKQSDRFIRPNFIFWSMVESCEEEDISDVEFEGSESDMEESPSIYSGGALARSIPASVDMASGDSGSVNDDNLMNDFELSLNKMSLDSPIKPMKEPQIPTNDILQFLKHTEKQPIPLPAKLTPDYLMHYSMSLL